MISLFVLSLICATHTTASVPVSYYTLSNPAFTAYYGNFHVFVEPRDVGDISVFSCSGRFNPWGVGVSNIRSGNGYPEERRNWASAAYHFKNFPLSLGINAGIVKIHDQTDALADLGVWLKRPLSVGINFSNIFNDGRILRGGAAYTWKFFILVAEIEDSLRSGALVPHGLLQFTYPVQNFTLTLSGGFYSGTVSGGIGIEYRRFITAQFFYEDIPDHNIKALIGIHFRPPVVVREIAVVETMTIKQPVIVEKTVIKKEPAPPPGTPQELTAEQQAYCETHYMKGIEFYVNNQIDAAIREWNLVTNVDPDYKDVKRNLENAQAKKALLKEE
ncbi:hypothetical protein JXB22_06780 [candidate division WOR-3 bacterium]|nr:hypothetical protein [candidate division WOR-3 bacterium]